LAGANDRHWRWFSNLKPDGNAGFRIHRKPEPGLPPKIGTKNIFALHFNRAVWGICKLCNARCGNEVALFPA
jgi:hypothetical protein